MIENKNSDYTREKLQRQCILLSKSTTSFFQEMGSLEFYPWSCTFYSEHRTGLVLFARLAWNQWNAQLVWTMSLVLNA